MAGGDASSLVFFVVSCSLRSYHI